MSKMILEGTATVYHGARRRYLSRKAAANSFFWAAIHRHCECEDPDYSDNYGGSSCSYHLGDFRDRMEALRRRFLAIHFGIRK